MPASYKNLLLVLFTVVILSCATMLSVFANDGAGAVCEMPANVHWVAVAQVLDGDTIITEQGVSVRAIGIDAPEIGRAGKASQPGAEAARQRLQELLVPSQQIGLVFDQDTTDKYDRQLAHWFLSDGRNVQALLLEDGWSSLFTYPPNLRFLPCYQQQAEIAMAAKRGIWRAAEYDVRAIGSLKKSERGYRRIQGKLERISVCPGGLCLRLKKASVRIRRGDLQWFDRAQLEAMVGEKVVARGFVYYAKKYQRWHMSIRHPSDLALF